MGFVCWKGYITLDKAPRVKKNSRSILYTSDVSELWLLLSQIEYIQPLFIHEKKNFEANKLVGSCTNKMHKKLQLIDKNNSYKI